MVQLLEWPEVITEGNSLEECREMLQDVLYEMVLAYRQQGKEVPVGGALLEQIHFDAHFNGNSRPHCDIDAQPNSHPDHHFDAHFNTNPQPECDSNAQPNSQTDHHLDAHFNGNQVSDVARS